MREHQRLSVVVFSSGRRKVHTTDPSNIPQTVSVMTAKLSGSVAFFGSVLDNVKDALC
jgi:hypothetical protein